MLAVRREKAAEKMRSDEMQSLSEKLRLHKDQVRLRTILLAAAAIFLVCALVIFHHVRVFHGYRLQSSVERSDDTATEYVRLENRTLKCNPNGVTCVNDSNEVQWNVTFTMQDPVVDVCGSRVAVGDRSGREIYVFDKNGQVGRYETEYSLNKVRVASQGVVAAVLEDGENTIINVYDTDGNVIVTDKTSMSGGMGYPVDLDISSDGQKLMISFLGMNESNIVTTVAFYNFSSVGQSQSDHLVNSVEYEGHVVPQVSFLSNDYAVAIRDDGLTFFRGRQVPEQKGEITSEQEMISVFYSDDYVGFVTASDEEDQEHAYKMQIYRENGSKSGTCYFDMEYSEISASGDEIILYNSTDVEIYNAGGRKRAAFSYDKEITSIMNVSGFRAYEIITPQSTDRIRLK